MQPPFPNAAARSSYTEPSRRRHAASDAVVGCEREVLVFKEGSMRRRVGVIVGMVTALAAAAALAESPGGLSHKTLRTIGEGRAV